METLQNEMTVELSTECDCTFIDENEIEIQVTDCSGECWTAEYEYFHNEFLPLWLRANGLDEDEIVRLEGSHMTWRNVSGYRDIEANKLVDSLTISGDFRLTFTLSSDYLTLKVRRGSHDEPMGAYFVVTKSEAKKCSWCSNITDCEILDNDYPNEFACVEHCLVVQKELAEMRNR